MKTNNEKPTLEQLLASVEHAGRDARRQQQLSDMIEQLSEIIYQPIVKNV